VNSSPDDLPEIPDTPVKGRASSPVQARVGTAAPGCPAERSSAEADSQSESGFASGASHLPNGQPANFVPAPPDPAWDGWDVLRIIFITIVALFACVFAVLFIAHRWFYPHARVAEIARVPMVLVAGQALAYLLILAYMYVLVTRERRRPDFLAAIHWNWPSNFVVYVFTGFVLSVVLQLFSHLLPIPKELPIDNFFRTPAEAWALGILSVTLAPLMEELFFRGFLYPVLARRLGLPFSVFLTALAFALLHLAQLGSAWGPVLMIFLVGLVLTMVRAKTNSVAAGILIHMAYNGTITLAMFAATDGFRHLEKLNQ
jgi:membrane protease YdiL (CAAX protease family)